MRRALHRERLALRVVMQPLLARHAPVLHTGTLALVRRYGVPWKRLARAGGARARGACDLHSAHPAALTEDDSEDARELACGSLALELRVRSEGADGR
jgi:hypothetical protein